MKKVIFICFANSARSQMAEGFMKKKISEKNLNLEVESAGISKIPFVHPFAILVMKEKGIDISNNRTKGIEEFDLREFDYIVNMVEGINFGKNMIYWNIEDPAGKDIEFFRKIRDEIEERVDYLISRIIIEEKIKTPFLTVDGIVEIYEDKKFKGIVLIERKNPPYGLALPGGFVNYGEKPEDAVLREIKEEIGIDAEIKKFFNFYGNPDRDPRIHTVSLVFILKGKGNLKPCSDAKNALLFEINKIPYEKIVFDHKKIIKDYIKFRKKY
jgi:8-oxo-dGTP diphosphatase